MKEFEFWKLIVWIIGSFVTGIGIGAKFLGGLESLKSILPKRPKPKIIQAKSCLSVTTDSNELNAHELTIEAMVNNAGGKPCSIIDTKASITGFVDKTETWTVKNPSSYQMLPISINPYETKALHIKCVVLKQMTYKWALDRNKIRKQKNLTLLGIVTLSITFDTSKVITTEIPCDFFTLS
jgi:hypothetical protein